MTLVESIITAINAAAAAELGGSWKELLDVFNVDNNSARGGKQAYGARPLPAASTPTVIRAYALDHQFELILTNPVTRAQGSAEAMTVIHDLYTKQDLIFRNMAASRLGLSAEGVLDVFGPSLSEPAFSQSGELVVLRQQFNVKYRRQIS